MNYKAYKYRLYPNKTQVESINKTFGCVRFVWNALVANFNLYGKDGFVKSLTYAKIRNNPEFEFLKEVSAGALQCKEIDFKETKKQFFNKKRKSKLSRMRFKKKGVCRDSFKLSYQKFTVDFDQNLIRLEKIGFVRISLSRHYSGKPISVTISRNAANQYFASILVKEEINQKPKTKKSIGLDLGLTHFLIDSDGNKMDNPKWFRENQSRLAKAQKHLSRKVKGSNRYSRQKLKVARIHNDIKNAREWFQHNLSTRLVNDYDIIVVEDLAVKNMIKNRKLSKSISDASWSSFVSMLAYKCEWYGKTLVKINRFFPSSKTCSECGVVHKEMTLDVREWTCEDCDAHHDRDINAAKNILKEGLNLLSAESVEYRRGENVRLQQSSMNRIEADLNETPNVCKN